jgi:PAS domain S-box-containing protein
VQEPATTGRLEGKSSEDRLAWAQAVLSALPTGSEPDEASRVILELVNRLEAMLEHTTDMITVVGGDGTIRYSNRAAGLLTGHDEDVNGTAAFDLIHPDDIDVAFGAFARCLEEPGKEELAEFRLRYADGSWHNVEAYAKNCLDSEVEGVVVSMRDVTERKAGEAALVAANQAMREFVAVASHELRTPTSVIHGFASTMDHRWNDLKDDDKREYLGAIARASDRLARLVDDLLTVSRLDAGADDFPPIRLELRSVVRSVIDELGAEAEGITVDVNDDVAVLANAHQARRIIRNYLENALRYGGAPISVEAEAVPEGLIAVRVRDSGDGVPQGFESRLFERFARADTDASRETAGTGLGLSIVRSLAHAVGGDAWYEPSTHGACFVATLPAAPPE